MSIDSRRLDSAARGTDSDFRKTTLVCLGVTALAMIAYGNVLGHDFLSWDDSVVENNPHLSNGFTFDGIIYSFTTFDSGNWIPLNWLTFQLDAACFGLSSAATHGTNLALHCLNSCLVFLVLRILTGSLVRSSIVAAFFAVHPLHVESVAWISERKDVLSTCLMLVTVLLYIRYANRPTTERFSFVVLGMALGLMAKPMLVTLPVLLLLIDFWPLQRWSAIKPKASSPNRIPLRSARELLLEKLPLIFVALCDGVMTVIAQSGAISELGAGAFASTEQAPLPTRLCHTIFAYGWYLQKTVCPVGLCAYYPHPSFALPWTSIGQSLLVLALITGYVIWRRSPPLIFGWLWFLISLLPVIGLMQVGGQAFADRYTYIPHIGLFVMIVWEADELLRKLGTSGRVFGSLLALGLTVALTVLTRAQVDTWHDEESVWTQAIRVDQFNAAGHFHLAAYLTKHGKYVDVDQHLMDVLVGLPNNRDAIASLARLRHKQSRFEEAIGYYEWWQQLDPQDREAQEGLGALQKYRTHPPEPPPSAAVIEKLKPGLVAASRRSFAEALPHFEAALALDPTLTLSHHLAANCLVALGRHAEAGRHFNEMLRRNPHNMAAKHGLDRLRKLRLIDPVDQEFFNSSSLR